MHTRFILNHHHDVLTLGCDVNTPDTIKMLAEWADRILLAEPQMRKQLPVKTHKKIDTEFTLGPDVWPTNLLQTLKTVCYRKLKKLKYI